MSTKATEIGDKVLIQTVASWHGGPYRASGGVLVAQNDAPARHAEVRKQARALRAAKGIATPSKEPVV